MKKLFKEFKEFISRGSVLDLAVGMIIGAAFTAIITSVVNYVLKPIIALIPIGNGGEFKSVLKTIYTLSDGTVYTIWGNKALTAQQAALVAADSSAVVNEIAIIWSEVISAVITFLATALVLFIIIKAINTAKKAAEKAKADAEAKKAKEEAPEAPAEEEAEPVPPAPTQEELLAQILEELKKQNK